MSMTCRGKIYYKMLFILFQQGHDLVGWWERVEDGFVVTLQEVNGCPEIEEGECVGLFKFFW